MSKIGYKELAQTIVGKYGLEQAAAEQFVDSMFGLLEQGIQADRQVKVKGLGTFKVVAVAPRKSVDVNTGEPIVIDGRDKVSFTPDSTMRELVNRPFSQFETVAVNEGVDFSAIDAHFAEQQDASDDNLPYTPRETAQEPADNPDEAADTADQSADASEEPDAQSEEETAPSEEETMNNADVNAPVEQTTSVEQSSTEEPTDENQTMNEEETMNGNGAMKSAPTANDEVSAKQTMLEAERLADDARNQVILMQQEMMRHNRFMRWFLGIGVVMLVACVAGMFYMAAQITQRDHRIEHLEAAAILASHTPQGQAIINASVDTVAVVRARQDSMEAARQLKEEESARQQREEAAKQQGAAARQQGEAVANQQKENAQQAKKTQQAQPAKQAQQNQHPAAAAGDKQQEKYNKDVRVRTGAYNIVGIDRTVTAKAGQTLAGISRTCLGPGMDCYMEAVNEGRTHLKAGDKVNIPKLKLKKKQSK